VTHGPVSERTAGATLSAGVLGADFLHLATDLDRLEEAGVRLLHVDVMDGVFCPQMTVGPAFVAALAERFPVDVHLMIDEPLQKVDAYVEAGARVVTFHVEATRHPHRVLQRLAGRGVTRGVALNPGTAVGALEPLLDDLELVLLLAVNPGWSGQVFIPGTAGRLAAVRELIGEREILVGIDGGVTRENAAGVAALGADVIVAGSALYAGGDVTNNAHHLLTATGVRSTSDRRFSTVQGAKEESDDGSGV
jgi:ribulose-phosphate 3-epimerase